MPSLSEKFPDEIWVAIFTDKELKYQHLKMLTRVSKSFRELIKVSDQYMQAVKSTENLLLVFDVQFSRQSSIQLFSELLCQNLKNLFSEVMSSFTHFYTYAAINATVTKLLLKPYR